MDALILGDFIIENAEMMGKAEMMEVNLTLILFLKHFWVALVIPFLGYFMSLFVFSSYLRVSLPIFDLKAKKEGGSDEFICPEPELGYSGNPGVDGSSFFPIGPDVPFVLMHRDLGFLRMSAPQ
jgi:hypothetical protein